MAYRTRGMGNMDPRRLGTTHNNNTLKPLPQNMLMNTLQYYECDELAVGGDTGCSPGENGRLWPKVWSNLKKIEGFEIALLL